MATVSLKNYAAVLLVFISACAATSDGVSGPAGDEHSRSQSSIPHRQGLPLSLQISGGIAGRLDALEITAAGQATWTDRRRPDSRSAPLAPSSLARLQEALAKISGETAAAAGPRFPGRCRDCFEYVLTLPAAGKVRTIVVLSDQLGGSEYRELIATLLAVVEEIKLAGR